MLKPSRLRKGDVIGIIAPCLAAEEEYIAQAEKALGQMGFSVKLGKNLYSRANGFSGSPEERAADFNEMLLDPKVRMIFFDGGEVSNEILPQATLTRALRQMEDDGLVHREVYGTIPPKVEYSLTEVGAGFKTVLASLENWGNQYIDYMKAAGRI